MKKIFLVFLCMSYTLNAGSNMNIKVKNRGITKDQAIKIAVADLRKYPNQYKEVVLASATLFSTPWNYVIPEEPNTDRDKKIFDILKNKTYWAIHFSPRIEQTGGPGGGGTIITFIDQKTGLILEHYAIR